MIEYKFKGVDKMKVGIIVYSYTGHTLSVANKLKEAIKDKGHEVIIELIEPMNNNPGPSSQVILKTSPDISGYDFIVFGSPVQAFTLAGVMKKYLLNLPHFEGKSAYCFVTRQLKRKWLGGSRAIKWIKTKCFEKGINIIDSGMISWSSNKLDNEIGSLVYKFSNIK
jgi:flavodoxin